MPLSRPIVRTLGEVETTRTEHRPPPLLDQDAGAVRAWLEAL